MNLTKLNLLILLLFFSSLYSFAQKWKTYSDSAETCFKNNMYQCATDWVEKAIQSYNKRKKQDTLFAMLLSRSGSYYLYVGKYESAANAYMGAVEIEEKIFGPQSKKYAASIHNAALAYTFMGKFDVAEDLFFKSLKLSIQLEGDSSRFTVKTLGNIGQLYYTKGDFFKAIEYLEKVVKISKSKGVDCNECYIKDLKILCEILSNIGNFELAEKYYNETLKFATLTYGENHKYIIGIKTGLAVLCMLNGYYGIADKLYNEILEWDKQNLQPDNPIFASDLTDYATLLFDLNQKDKAEACIRQAISITEKNGIECNRCYGNMITSLALIHSDNKEFTQADSLLRYALSFSKKKLGETDKRTIDIGFNIGSVNYKAGEADTARKYILEAIQKTENTEIICNECYASMLASISYIYLEEQKYAMADSFINKARDFVFERFNKNNRINYGMFKQKITYFNALNNYLKANDSYKESFRSQEELIQKNFNFLNEKEKKLFFTDIKDNFEEYCSFVGQHYMVYPQFITELFYFRVKTKGILFNSVKRMINDIYDSHDPALIKLFDEWKLKREFFANYNMKTNASDNDAINIDKLEIELDSIEKELANRTGNYNFFQADTNRIFIKKWQNILKKNESFIELIRFRNYSEITDTVTFYGKKNVKKRLDFTDSISYAALIITADTGQHPKFILLDSGNDLENKYFNNYKMSIRHKKEDRISYNEYWKQIADVIPDVKKVFFSPDGVYNQINLYSLYNPVTNKYLIDETDITLLSHPEDLFTILDTNKEKEFPKTISLIGNIKYTTDSTMTDRSSSASSFPELPGTKIEIENIKKIMEIKGWDCKIIDNQNATKETVRKLQSPGYIHIASHGIYVTQKDFTDKYFLGIDTSMYSLNVLLKPGLVFARDSLNDENNVLSAYEIMNLNLQNTEMVVLSACETGLGDIDFSEGVNGFCRAFQTAGAHSVVMSLWKIDDSATQQLMTAFYNQINNSISPTSALKNAQLELKRKNIHPYYWGSFIVQEK